MTLKEYQKIDLETGKIVDVVLFDPETDEIPEDCKEGWAGDQGMHEPIWSFAENKWVEDNNSKALLNHMITRKGAELGIACKQEILGYFQVKLQGKNYYFSNDAEAQSNFEKMDRAFEKGRINQLKWTCYDKNWNVKRLLLNAKMFEVVYEAHLNHIQGNIARFRDELMVQLSQATTVEEIESIVWTPFNSS